MRLLMITNHGFLRLKTWDFASMLVIASMGGTWDLGPHVNRPLIKKYGGRGGSIGVQMGFKLPYWFHV